jgi:VWFA-related protein
VADPDLNELEGLNMKSPVNLAVLLMVSAGVVLTGQTPAPAPQAQQPTFKLRVDYVEVDVVVSDRQGTLIRDLKKEDFQVLEDGKAQAITNFSLVDIPIERYDRPLFATAPIEPDVKTNERPFDGRVYVMVIDDLHTRFGRSQRVKIAARQFVERRLGANDLMAIVHTAGATDANQEFTTNKRLLLASVDKRRAAGSTRQPPTRPRSSTARAICASRATRSTTPTMPSARSTRGTRSIRSRTWPNGSRRCAAAESRSCS